MTSGGGAVIAKLVIRKIGNSHGVILPQEVLTARGARRGCVDCYPQWQ